MAGCSSSSLGCTTFNFPFAAFEPIERRDGLRLPILVERSPGADWWLSPWQGSRPSQSQIQEHMRTHENHVLPSGQQSGRQTLRNAAAIISAGIEYHRSVMQQALSVCGPKLSNASSRLSLNSSRKTSSCFLTRYFADGGLVRAPRVRTSYSQLCPPSERTLQFPCVADFAKTRHAQNN